MKPQKVRCFFFPHIIFACSAKKYTGLESGVVGVVVVAVAVVVDFMLRSVYQLFTHIHIAILK